MKPKCALCQRLQVNEIETNLEQAYGDLMVDKLLGLILTFVNPLAL